MIKKIITVGVGIMVAWGVMEVTVRMLPQNYSENITRWDKDTGLLVYEKNANGEHKKECLDVRVKTNSLGWRDREFSPQKEQGVYRVMVLGDSFVAAHEVAIEQIFHKVLEQKLQEKLGKDKVEVIALARGGSGLYYYYRFLKDYGMEYEPDMILVMTFYNDPLDDINDLHGARSHVFDFTDEGRIIDRYELKAPMWLLAAKKQAVKSRAVKFVYETIKHIFERENEDLVHKEESVDVGLAFALEEAILRKIQGLGERVGAKVLVANSPAGETMKFENSPEEFFYFGPYSHEEMFTRLSEKLDIPFFNLLPDMRKKKVESGERIDFPCDFHWNETGHAWIADLLYERLLPELNAQVNP